MNNNLKNDYFFILKPDARKNTYFQFFFLDINKLDKNK